MATKKRNENDKWINNKTKELEKVEEDPKTEINIDLFKTTLKKISKWKHHAMMKYMVSGSRK